MKLSGNGVLIAGLAAMTAPFMAPTVASAEVGYAGKTVKIVIPYGPGGTYDKYGQTFAKHLKQYVPGNPNIIVQHMPGAGGGKAMNWAYNVMPADGYNMIVPLDNGVVTQLMRPVKARWDMRKFTWLGSSNQTNVVLVARSDSGVKNWKDLRNKRIIAGATGKNSTGYIMQRLLTSIFKLNVKMVSGYKGSSKTIFAVERGEVQMYAANWLAWSSKVPHWFKGEKVFANPIIQMGVFRDPDLSKDIPMISDMVKNEMDKKAVNFIKVLGLLGRGLTMPPKTPRDAIKTLRTAYDKMNKDRAFFKELKKRRLRLIPSSGATIQKLVNKAIDDATPAVVKHATKVVFGG
jgi:tripartite-type tricarboxylate transporter receptor subunit TctC